MQIVMQIDGGQRHELEAMIKDLEEENRYSWHAHTAGNHLFGSGRFSDEKENKGILFTLCHCIWALLRGTAHSKPA